MTFITGSDITSIYRKLLARHALSTARRVESRLGPMVETLGAHVILTNPLANLLVSPARRLNYSFSIAEWIHILTGSNDAPTMIAYNRQMANHSDDGETFAGAYGPMVLEQLPYIIDTLRKDIFSRQAVLTIWRQRPRASKDIPCTVSMQFLIREVGVIAVPELTMIVNMRSNDLWLGFPYDVFNFTQLQQYVAMKLGVRVGEYHHIAGSMHLYDYDQDKAALVVIENSTWVPESWVIREPMPAMFRSTFYALSLMSQRGDKSALDLVQRLEGNGMSDEWWGYLRVLSYHFHRDYHVLPQPYGSLIAGKIHD